jgi:hypothetical protein
VLRLPCAITSWCWQEVAAAEVRGAATPTHMGAGRARRPACMPPFFLVDMTAAHVECFPWPT